MQPSPDLITAPSSCSQSVQEAATLSQCSAFAPKPAGISHIQLKTAAGGAEGWGARAPSSFLAATWLWDRLQSKMKTKGKQLPFSQSRGHEWERCVWDPQEQSCLPFSFLLRARSPVTLSSPAPRPQEVRLEIKAGFWGALSWAWLSQVPQQQNLGRLRFPSGGRAAGAGDPGHLSSIRHGNELNLGDSLEPGDGDLLGFGSKTWH